MVFNTYLGITSTGLPGGNPETEPETEKNRRRKKHQFRIETFFIAKKKLYYHSFEKQKYLYAVRM